MFSLNNQHTCWTRQIFHPTIVPSQRCHLGISHIVQSPPLTGISYLNHLCLLLDWNICEANIQHIITFTCNKGLRVDWIPASSRHHHLHQIIFIQVTSKFLLTFIFMQHQSSWVHIVIFLLSLSFPFQYQTLCLLMSKVSTLTWL